MITPAKAQAPLEIGKGDLKIAIHHPEDGAYQGSRFDRSGLFYYLEYKGTNICDKWNPSTDPKRHDTLQGLAEEFSVIGYDGIKPGETFIKIGIGRVLKADNEPFNRFGYYETVDTGKWTVEATKTRITMTQVTGDYEYTKVIEINSGNSFTISHILKNTGKIALEGTVYNHNFFTLGVLETSPSRHIELGYRPVGYWKRKDDLVEATATGFEFLKKFEEGESMQMELLHKEGEKGVPVSFSVSEDRTGYKVSCEGSHYGLESVCWANCRVACFEPYNGFSVKPGESFEWSLKYKVSKK